MKNNGKSSTPIIAARSKKNNGHKPAPPAQKKASGTARVSRVSRNATPKVKSLVLDRISDGVLAFDAGMNHIYVNERAGELLGREPQELVGKNFWQEYPDSTGSPFADACQRAFETQTMVPFDGYFPPSDSWFEGRVYPSSDGLSVLISDAAQPEPREMINALEKSDEKFSKAFHSSPSAIAIIRTKDRHIVDINQNFLKLFGLESRGVIGKTPRELGIHMPGDWREILTQIWQEQGSIHQQELEIHIPSGELRHLLLSVELIEIENEECILVSAIDITERKSTQDKVREASQFPMQNPNPVMRFTRDGRLLYNNPASASLLEVWKQQTEDGIPPRLRELLAVVAESGDNREIEFQNHEKTYTCLLVPVPESGYVNLYFNDISERKQAQESLQALIHQTSTGMTRTSLDGRFVFVNQAFCDMLGYSEAELIGRTIWEISHPDDIAKNQRMLERMASDGEPYQLEKRLLRRNGSIVWASVGTSPLRDAQGKTIAAVSIVVDITRRKRAEESLLDSARRTLYLSSLSDAIRPLSSSAQIETEAVRILGLHLKAGRVAYARVKGDGTLLVSSNYTSGVEQWIGTFDISQYIPPGMLSKFRAGRAVVMSGPAMAATNAESAAASKESSPILSQIVIPLIRDGEPVAALFVQHLWAREWKNEEIHLVEETAERMQAAIERARAERELRESEKRFRILSNTVPSMVWSTAPDGTIQYLNEHWHNYTGLTTDESVSSWAELSLHPDDYEACMAAWKHALATVPDEYLNEVRYRRYDGEYRWFQSRAIPARDENGNVTAWYGVSTDINDRVEKQEELQAVINQTPFMFTRCSRDLRYRFVSRTYAEMVGRTPEELAGRPIVEIMGEEGLKTIMPYVEQVLQGERVEYETEVPFEGVRTPFLHVTYMPDHDGQGNVVGWFASITDVTERKRMENELRESERKFSLIYDNLPFAAALSRPQDGALMDVNREFERVFGYRKQDVIGRTSLELGINPDAKNRERILAEIQARGSARDYEVKLLTRVHGMRDFSINLDMVTINDEKYILQTTQDITERKLAEEWQRLSAENLRAAAEANAKFRAFFDQGSYFAGVMTLDGTLVEANRLCLDFCGFTRDDVIGKKFWDCGWWNPSPELMDMVRGGTQQAAEGRLFRQESTYYLADGSERFVDLIIAPVRDDAGHILFLVPTGTDITERRQMENALRESEAKLTDELTASKQLQAISSQLIREDNIKLLYEQIIEAAMSLMGSEMGSIQMLYPEKNELQLLAYKGFDPKAAEFWDRVHLHSASTCGMALRTGERVIVPDVEASGFLAGTEDLDFYRLSGIRAVQSTPLVSRDGHLVGMISTHWQEAYQPGERELQLLDVLARQAADLIERKRAEGELRISEHKFSRIFHSAPYAVVLNSFPDAKFVDVNDAFTALIGYDRDELIGKTTVELGINLDSQTQKETLQDYEKYGSIRGREFQLQKKSGESVWISINGNLVELSGEKYILSLILDVTERKKAEEQLRASEEKYRQIIETANEGIWEIDSDAGTAFVNPRMAEMLGYAPEEMIGHSAFEFLLPEDDVEGQNRLERAKSGIAARSSEFRYRRKDGSILWALASSKPQLDEDGNFLGSVAMLTDISERKQFERSLIEYARQQTALYGLADQLHRTHSLDEMYEASLDAIRKALLCDRASILLFDEKDVMRFVAWQGLSDEYRKATDGHSPWKVGEKNPVPIFYNDASNSDLSDSLRAVIAREGIGSLAFIPVVFQGQLIGKFTVYYNAPHVFRETELDIGTTIARQLASGVDRKRSEEALRQSEERFARFMQYLPGLAWIKDRQGRYVYANAAAEKAFNTPQAELYGKTDEDIFPAEVAAQFKQNDERALMEGKGVQIVETLPQVDGLIHHSLVTKFPIPGPDGTAAMIGGTALDITERKQMEDELLASRQRLSATYEYAPIGMVEYSVDGRYLKVNEEFCRILGYEKDELLKMKVEDITYEADYPADEAFYRQLIRGEIPSYRVEKRYKRKDGSLIWAQKTRSAVRNAQGKMLYTIGAIIDISERKQAEDRLLLLAAVSELTRNVEDPIALMSAVANAVGSHLHVKRCLFNEIDVENDIEIVHNDYHDGTESVAGVHRISEYSSITSAEMEKGKTVVNTDSKIDLRTAQDYERSYVSNGERAYIAVPLMRDERWVASLWVSDDKPRTWSREEISLLETVAERAWTATEKLRINAALRDSEERLRVTFNTTAVGFATLDLNTRFMEVNDAFCSIVGYSRPELLDMTSDALTHPDYIASMREFVAKLLADDIPSFVLEKIYIRSDQREIWVQDSVSIVRDEDGDPLHLIAICQDITERKRTEDELHQLNLQLENRVQKRTAELEAANQFLRESEATARLILESMPDAIVIADRNGQIVYSNTQVENLFSYSPKEVIGQQVEMLIPQRFHERHVDFRQDYSEQPHRRYMGLGRDLFGQRKDNSEFPVDVMLSPISNNTNWDVMITIRDNTEQKQAQEALRANEEKLRKLFEVLPVGISFLGNEGQITELNFALTNILGLTKRELFEGKFKPRRYIRADGTPMPPSEFASTRALTEQKTINNVETGIVKENGEIVWTSVSATPVDVADVNVVVATVDITERKKAEDALHKHRERLRLLSRRLVEVQEEERRAIARELHDRVGQNLAALNLNLNILRGQLSSEVLQTIGTRLDDSVSLVNQILMITRSVMSDLRSNVLDDYGLESALREFAEQFTQRTGIQVVSDKSVTTIPRLEPGIEMTLLRIAQEALTNVARHAQAHQATISVSMDNEAIYMSIQDDGIGILSWQRANQAGSHGLRIIRERAEAFGGSLQVHSTYKKGTRIEVKIPLGGSSSKKVPREKHS